MYNFAKEMTIDNTKYYVFYDGDCGFCNHWVEWILKNDKKDQFRFVALQSDFGFSFLSERRLNTKDFTTLYLWKPNEFYFSKSQAVSKVAYLLGGRYRVLSYLNFLPQNITDMLYDIIAKNRHKITKKHCYIPTDKEREKFVN